GPHVLHEPLQVLYLAHIFLAQSCKLGRVTQGEGEDLGDMHADDVLGVNATHLRGDERADIIAMRTIAIIAESVHQLSPCPGGAVAVPTPLAGGSGKTEAGQ